MKIVYCAYYDHIVRGGYIPHIIVENWDAERVVFLSNADEMQVAMDMGVDAQLVNIGIGIQSPSDIATAYNACVDYCYDVLQADWVVSVLGDHYITPKGAKLIKEFLVANKDNVTIVNIPIMTVQLFVQLWPQFTSLNISCKAARIRHFDDGLLTNVYNQLTDDLDCILDTGYLGTKQYYERTRNHAHIWPSNGKKFWLGMYDQDKAYAVRMVYEDLRTIHGLPIDHIDARLYGHLMGVLGLWDDFHYCMGVRREYLGL